MMVARIHSDRVCAYVYTGTLACKVKQHSDIMYGILSYAQYSRMIHPEGKTVESYEPSNQKMCSPTFKHDIMRTLGQDSEIILSANVCRFEQFT